MERLTTVPCGICGTPTTKTGTVRCDRCWELETRIKGDIDLAFLILERVGYNAIKPTEERA